MNRIVVIVECDHPTSKDLGRVLAWMHSVYGEDARVEIGRATTIDASNALLLKIGPYEPAV